MSRFSQGEHDDVESELRRFRPELPPAFLATLSEDLHERMRRPRAVRRAALVSALTVGMLTVFATLGGIGYASSAAQSAFHASKLERVVGISHASHATNVSRQSHSTKSVPSRFTQAKSNAPTGDNPVFGDQYRPGKGCGDKNHIHARENECKKPPK